MLIGHDNLIRDFKVLADERKLGHGYIFFGPARVGKRTFASALARYLETGEFSPAPAGAVLSDVLEIRPDEMKTVGIDRIREIKNFLWQMPNRSPYRTVVIDGPPAGGLSDEAQNALLKVAEEPPKAGLILLVMDDFERLRPTLQSRLQRIFFAPVERQAVEEWLVREMSCTRDKAGALAEKCRGRPGLAWAALCDARFQEYQDMVRRFLRAPRDKRSTTLKEILEDEHFDLSDFLEALLLAVPAKEINFRFWHAALDLRRQANYFNLNPRLQLLALAQVVERVA